MRGQGDVRHRDRFTRHADNIDISRAIRLQVAGIDLKHFGGDLQHHLAGFPGGGNHGVAGAMRSPRGERSHAMRSRIRVRGVDDDALGRYAESLGTDLRHDRLQSLSKIDA